MPGQKPIKSDSWAWFKAELDRLLGSDQAAALWDELTRRRRMESDAKQRKRAAREVAYFEQHLADAKAAGRATARIEACLARWRRIAESSDDPPS